MAPLSIIGALSALPLAFAHMQMSSPSPLRDPHATDRPDEPKDYNILSPLNADGSNFACKGYHLNTPLTTVATYAAGSKQTLRLKGSATHGGGSCQISLSCDGGDVFHVIKSIIGGCPLRNSYDFIVPSNLPASKKCLLAWTWFNKIGNREMYMNCAVVDITNKRQSKRDTQISASSALSRYPELFVANLANINSCKIQETTDVIFDNPGRDVDYGNGDDASMKPSFNKGECTGKPSKNAGSKDTSSSNSGGKWSAPAQSSSKTSSNSNDCAAKNRDGFYHPECAGGNAPTKQQVQKPTQQQPQQRPQQQQQSQPQKQSASKQQNKNKPNTRVQQELDAYLATLYGRGLARRDAVPAPSYVGTHGSKENSASPHQHAHGKNCEHKSSGPQHHHEEKESYPDVDYHNKHAYNSQVPHYGDTDYVYKRVNRERRWTTYNKRDEVLRVAPVPKKYYRGHESEYVQPAPSQVSTAVSASQASTDTSNQASTASFNQAPTDSSDQVSTLGLKQASTEATAEDSTQAEAQTASEAPVYKIWNDMSESEKFDAFLRRMVELSNNMASLVKYAAASTVNLPWYPPASTNDRATASADASTQRDTVVHRLARRGGAVSARAPAQVYPGPSVGSISAPGDATDADEGFHLWFPHLVPGLTKRQLVDPVTSEASAEANDNVGFFDALAAGFWKLFGDPFEYYSDSDTDSDLVSVLLDLEPVPATEDIPALLGEPDFYNSNPEFPDFDIPDLDGHFTAPPQIFAPEPPLPELLPGYEEGPDGPIWVGEGPDPLSDDGPSIIIAVSSSIIPFPGEDPSLPTLTACFAPIPQVGFNSCWGGCNHTASEIAAHETYLKEFAQQQADYETCVQSQTQVEGEGEVSPPSHIIWHHNSANEDGEVEWEGDKEAEDASHRRPRPGWSHPLIPSPSPENFTGSLPPSSSSPSDGTVDALPATDTDNAVPTDTAVLMPYHNKTLGELVTEILENPDILASPDVSDVIDDSVSVDGEATNPLQQAADEAEAGVTIPQEAVEFDPSKVDSVVDALPWFLGPGPVEVEGVDGAGAE